MPSVVLAFLLCVFTSRQSPAATLHVQFPSEPTHYDPLLIEDGVGLKLVANTIGTLYEYDGRGLLHPALVEDVSINRDHTRYSFRFKKGLKWSDGVEFKAQHFILAIQRLSQASVKSATSQFFPKFNLSETRAIDNRVAEIKLDGPDALFLNWCTLSALAPIRQDMIEAYQKRPDPVVPSMGAYRVTDYKRSEHLSLKKNPNFYRAREVSIDDVEIHFITDETALYSLLKSGTLDLLFKVPVLQADEIKKIATLDSVPVEAVTYLGLNTKKAPFSEKKNRQLFRDALFSKKSELARVLKTDEIPAQYLVPGILWPKPEARHAPVPAASADAKLAFDLQSDVGSRNQSILEFVQSEAKNNLGWTLKLDLMEWKAHYDKLKSDPDSAYRFGWQNPVSDPYLIYQIFESKSPNNFTGWSNPNYDRLVAKLRQETRQVKKLQLMHDLEEILWEEAPVVPLLHQVLKFAYSKRVMGFRANSFGNVLFGELRLK